MKSLIILIATAFLFTFSSCGGSSTKEGTHTHDDGSVHESHDADTKAAPTEQESFKVEGDSTATPAAEAKKADDHNHDHDHSAETGHKH